MLIQGNRLQKIYNNMYLLFSFTVAKSFKKISVF